jgi:hypothetical protein
VRVFLTMIVGITLLGGCAAKPTAGSAQAVSAQEDKDRVACLEEPLKKEAHDERQKSFASCMRARGYHDDKLYLSETTANARNPSTDDGSKSMARESSPGLAESEDYERAVADYNNCVLEHTSNLSACQKQQAIMNGLGKISSRLSLSQSYQITPTTSQTTNTAGATQGVNTANTTSATLSQVPARIPQTPQAAPSQTPAPIAPLTTSSRIPAPLSLAPPVTSSLPAQVSPPQVSPPQVSPPPRETEPVNAPLPDRPIPF